MKKTHRFLALLMTVVMIIGMVPMTAFAADGDGVTTPDLPVCDHVNTTTTTVEATCQEAGSITETCNDCGEVISTAVGDAQLEHTPGTCENCAIRLDPEVENTLTAGTDLYYVAYNVNGMTATFTNAASVTYNDETHEAVDGVITIADLAAGRGVPAQFQITVAEGATATASFAFPVGHPQNPNTLYMGSNTSTVEANNADGYNYTWTATHDGEITITMPADSGWAYCWNNLTAGIYGDLIFSDSTDATHTYAVTAGDEITLMVNSYDPESWDTPAATIEFTANYPVGHVANPIILDVPGPNDLAVGTNNYAAYNVNGMIITINGAESAIYNGETYNAVDGVITIEGLTTGRGMPAAFEITAAEGATASFSFPAGHLENPAALVIGENTATVEANNWDGYIFNWTATANGNLELILPESGWQYTLNNLTTGVSGDLMDYTLTDASHVYAVTEGDEIQIMVNSFDAEDTWNTPAASITFTAEFTPCDHTVTATDNGDGTHNVSACACGLNAAIENEAHNFVDGICSVCASEEPSDEPVLVESITMGHNLELQSSLRINWIVAQDLVENSDECYVVFTKNEGYVEATREIELTVDSSEMRQRADGKYLATFSYISACDICVDITATLYYVRDGVTYCSKPDVYSVKTYATALIALNEPYANTYDSCKNQVWVAVALLNYGTEVQKYFGFMTNRLANADLTESQKAYAEQSCNYVNNRNWGSTNTTSVVVFSGSNIEVQAEISSGIKVNTSKYSGNVSELTAVFTVKDTGAVAQIVEGANFRASDTNVYYIDFNAPDALNMRTVYEIVVYANYGASNQSVVSSTATYSIESYTYLANNAGIDVAPVALAMLKYGDAAVAALSNN